MKKNAEIIRLPTIKKVTADKKVPDNEIWLYWQPANGKEVLVAKIDCKRLKYK